MMGALDSVIDNILQGIYSHKLGTKGILWTFIHVDNHTASHIQIDRQTDISLIEKTCVINNNTKKIDMINTCNCLRVFSPSFLCIFLLEKTTMPYGLAEKFSQSHGNSRKLQHRTRFGLSQPMFTKY